MLLTRIPVGGLAQGNAQAMRAAVAFHPAVGLVVGCVGTGAYWAAFPLGIEVAALVSVLATVLLTGALHEDGLADCCDAFFGAHTKQDVLRIMKDSRVGTYGALAVVFTVALRWQLVAALEPVQVGVALLGVHAVARTTPLVLMGTMSYVSQASSKSSSLLGRVHVPALLVGLACGTGVMFLMVPHPAIAVVVVLGWTMLVRRYIVRRIGGYTGDCLGALEQTTEILVLGWVAWT